MMQTAIIDYGAGNLLSVKKALDFIGMNNIITSNEEEIEECQSIILPGVGAFPDAMMAIRAKGLEKVLKRQAQKKPFLGICLGMQLLFEKGYEFSTCDGLGILEGYVDKISFSGLKIPHMGWNSLKFLTPSPLLSETKENSYVYFVHSYKVFTDDSNINAFVEYGESIPALVGKNNVFGTQFHPEKSGSVGIEILMTFKKITKAMSERAQT